MMACDRCVELAELGDDVPTFIAQRRVIWALEDEVARLTAALEAAEARIPAAAPKRARVRRHDDRSRFARARRSAAARRKPWSLTREEYDAEVAKPCSYCGGPNGDRIGLDRLDNRLGYVAGNVQSSCGRCNNLRMNKLTVEETHAAVAAILAVRGAVAIEPS